MVRTPHKLVVNAGILLVLGIFIAACSGRRPAAPVAPVPQADVVMATPDSQGVASGATIEVVGRPESAAARVYAYDDAGFTEPVSSFDIQHTTLSLAFDLPGERVIGAAVHRLTSTVQLLTHLHFDARDMEIQGVSIKRPDGDFESVPFQYNDTDLTISLQPGVGKTVALEVRIDYIAHPMQNGRKLGMYFVDGQGTDASRPTQVWTLGQPEDNQYWFPSWDYPNDRMTFDLSLTVPQNFSTIANGDLVEQRALPDNMRRDRWVMRKAHPSYLQGFAIGEFAAVVDSYTRRDGSEVPLAYLMEPAYALHADLIFGETPAIMRFFERNLGITYPWSNYKQVAVRDFTARGMENTTASILYAGIQHDQRAHLDYTGRELLTHELAHQWFGNMVSVRNWANLALNEGFATYFERVYKEQEYGIAEAQSQTLDDRNAYLEEAKTLLRPIVWHEYNDPNLMFDSHTYEKAALVLHQLRFELGDDVWWRGVRQFLTKNAFNTALVADLQSAMEQAAGKGLGGFFQQWYRRAGHPVLQVSQAYNPGQGIYEVRVRQMQDSLQIGNFAFDVDIEVNIPGAAPWVSRYRVASRDTTYRFAIAGDVSFVRFDPGDWILADMSVTKGLSEWQNQARYDDEPAGRYDAVVALGKLDQNVNIRNVLLHVLQTDDAAFVRKAAAEALVIYGLEEEVRPFLLSAVKNDKNAAVRRQALWTLGSKNDNFLQEGLNAAIADDSYLVAAEAVRLYADIDPAQAIQQMRPLYDVTSWNNVVEKAMIAAYGRIRAIEGIPYLEARLHPETEESVQLAAFDALSGIARYNPDVQGSIAEIIMLRLDNPREPVRLAAVEALAPILDDNVVGRLNRMLGTETSPTVRQAINNIVNTGN